MASGAMRSSSEITTARLPTRSGSVTASVAEQHERGIDAGHVDAARHGTRGDRHDVRPGLADVVGRRLATEHDVDAGPLQAPLLPTDPPAVSWRSSSAGPRPRAGHPATRRAPTAATRWPRSAICPANSVPAGPPPMTSTERGSAARAGRPLVLATGVRVHPAGERQVLDHAAVDALLEADARPDLLLPGRPTT